MAVTKYIYPITHDASFADSGTPCEFTTANNRAAHVHFIETLDSYDKIFNTLWTFRDNQISNTNYLGLQASISFSANPLTGATPGDYEVYVKMWGKEFASSTSPLYMQEYRTPLIGTSISDTLVYTIPADKISSIGYAYIGIRIQPVAGPVQPTGDVTCILDVVSVRMQYLGPPPVVDYGTSPYVYDYLNENTVSSFLVQNRSNDSFYNPVALIHNGYAADGSKYTDGVANTGDKATWFLEVENRYRSNVPAFPTKALLLITTSALHILDGSDLNLNRWMTFLLENRCAFSDNFLLSLCSFSPKTIQFSNGVVTVVYNPDAGSYLQSRLVLNIDFVKDSCYMDFNTSEEGLSTLYGLSGGSPTISIS